MFLVGVILLALLRSAAYSQESRRRDSAETVFSKSAVKVVSLITKKGGELHAIASGVILTADGYVATNLHALRGADQVEIRFFPDPTKLEDYQSFNAPKLLHSDPDRDIAILKVNSSSLPFLAMQDSPLHVGETVYAIGNPKGLTNTISEGIVSAVRLVDGENVIQHTAAISPGSSGGALVNASGQLLGMNSWQMADGQNLNFAISASHLFEALAIARRTATSLAFPADASSGIDADDRNSFSQAAAALRTIAESIKSCPRIIEFEAENDSRKNEGPLTRSRIYAGPPLNVVWDATRSSSVRSPYVGYIEFTVPREYWVPPDILEKYVKRADVAKFYAEFLAPKPNLKYRYEFDMGPAGLDLTRMLTRPADKAEWEDDRPGKRGACSLSGCAMFCWESAVQSSRTMSQPKAPPQ